MLTTPPTSLALKGHAATGQVLAYLNALAAKDSLAFARYFHPSEEWPFRVILPGALRVASAQELIALHTAWFANAHCQFRPLTRRRDVAAAFQYEDLEDATLYQGSLLQCGVRVHVVKQKTLGDGKSALVTVPMYLCLQFHVDEKAAWWPVYIQNTPIDE